jgi:D-glycero-D-manno-heptose 1,7-bisphosphate phosphatase
MNRACLFDLDGTLVRAFPEGETTRGPRTRDEVEILPGTEENLFRLVEAGYLLLVVTNQPGIARGDVDPLSHCGVRLMIRAELPVRKIYMCPHQGEWCACRKGRPGLVFQAAVEHELDLSKCWMIGDRETDMQAGDAAGCRNVLVKTNDGIARAVEFILSQEKPNGPQ